MDSRGYLYDVRDEADAIRRGLTPVRRDLTPEERERGRIRFCDPCGCGSGKKFKACCYGKVTTVQQGPSP